MKNILLIVLVFTLTAGVINSQSVRFTTLQYTDVTDSSVSHPGDTDDALLEESLRVINTTGSTLTIECKRYETSVVSGTKNYFCWKDCYNPVDAGTKKKWTAPDPVVIAAGDTFSNFHAYYMPQNISGTSTFRYVLWVQNDPNDSIFVDIEFPVTAVSNEKELSGPEFSVYPNPAQSFVRFELISPEKANAQWMDMNGRVIKQHEVLPFSSEKTDISDLPEGVYILQLSSENSGSSVRKVLIGK